MIQHGCSSSVDQEKIDSEQHHCKRALPRISEPDRGELIRLFDPVTTNCFGGEGLDCFSPEHKRMRLNEDWNGMVSPDSSVPTVDEEPTKEQWWKRKHDPQLILQPFSIQQNQSTIGYTDREPCLLCHVCQKSYHRPAVATSICAAVGTSETVGKKHHKTILSYFNPRATHQSHPTTRSSAIARPSDPVPTLNSTERQCHFCERTDVCSNCMHPCGICEQWFCTFCSTTDYSTDPMRIVCLDCHQGQLHKMENGQETKHLEVAIDLQDHMEID